MSAAGISPDTPPRLKKARRVQKYRKEWEEGNPWLERVVENDLKANCKACRKVFSISHGGVTDVKQHAAGELHRRNIRSFRSQASVAHFFVPDTSPELDLVSYPQNIFR